MAIVRPGDCQAFGSHQNKLAPHLPCPPKTNVSQGDTAKDKQNGDTGERQEPGENVSSTWGQIDVREAAEYEL